MEELGLKAQIRIQGDSSACHGVLHREGSGRIKHLALKQLWLQSHVKPGEIVFEKVPRASNTADSLVKYWGQEGPEMFKKLGFYAMPGDGKVLQSGVGAIRWIKKSAGGPDYECHWKASGPPKQTTFSKEGSGGEAGGRREE